LTVGDEDLGSGSQAQGAQGMARFFLGKRDGRIHGVGRGVKPGFVETRGHAGRDFSGSLKRFF
jgi:hypothetical protein